MLEEMEKSASTPAPKRSMEKPASQKASKV